MSQPTHKFDIDEFRVSPDELEPGDTIVVYSPPSQGGRAYRIKSVVETRRRPGRFEVLCADERTHWWEAEYDGATGEPLMDGYAVRIPDNRLCEMLESGLSCVTRRECSVCGQRATEMKLDLVTFRDVEDEDYLGACPDELDPDQPLCPDCFDRMVPVEGGAA